jgi:hypothetical protein
MPDEETVDIEQEEGQAENGAEQTQDTTETPKKSGVIPELGAPAFKNAMGESKMNEEKASMKEVIDGFMEQIHAGKTMTKKETLDALSNNMSEEAWGEANKEKFFNDNKWRAELEQRLLKKVMSKNESKMNEKDERIMYSGGITQDEISSYLNDLRDSGDTNMFGAGAYVEREFGLSKAEARKALVYWMEHFKADESKANKSKIDMAYEELADMDLHDPTMIDDVAKRLGLTQEQIGKVVNDLIIQQHENESKINEDEYYDIVRFHQDGKRKVIQRHVTEEEAKKHCKDPSTKKKGEWFDGYVKESKMSKMLEKFGLLESPVIDKLLEKFGLIPSAIDRLLEKYKVNEVDDKDTMFKAPKNVEDLEKSTGDKPETADVPMDSGAPEAEMPAEGGAAPALSGSEPAPTGIEPKAMDMSNPESAKADIKMKYPEEPYTSTAMSYADSLIDDPKVYGAIRNLKWQGTYTNSESFLKQAKIVGNYNEFNPEIAKRLVDAVGEGAKFRMAREGSVAVYFTIRNIDKKISLETLRELVRADEAEPTGNQGEARIWWD